MKLVNLRALASAATVWLALASCVVTERKFDQALANAHNNPDSKDSGAPAPSLSSSAAPEQADPLCDEYCDAVISACKKCDAANPNCGPIGLDKKQAQGYSAYDPAPDSSKANCKATCHLLSHDTDPEGNTVECRLKQAKYATNGELTECAGASPGGGASRSTSACGTNCETYCDLYAQVCGGDAEVPTDPAVCRQRCAGLAEDDFFDWGYHHGTDTVQCRIVHLTSAATAAAKGDESTRKTHCSHAALFLAQGGGNCSVPADVDISCTDYCRLITASCTGDAAQFDRKDCKATCEAIKDFAVGDYGDNSQNSLGCRLYHAHASLRAPAAHCNHAGLGGDGHCGRDNCETYCALSQRECLAEFTLAFGTTAKCESECARLPGAEKDGLATTDFTDTSDNLKCRLNALTRAYGGADSCAAVFGKAAPCR